MSKIGIIVTLGILIGLSSCRHTSEDETESKLQWGHLAEDSLAPESPQFLINKKPSETYRVCLADYLKAELPGIEGEISAAINIWAHYIGRKIPVIIEARPLSRSTVTDTVESLSDSYFKACGSGFDVVVGFGPLDGGTVGVTGASYSFRALPNGKRDIVSFKRFLFLRDFAVRPFGDGSENKGWVSLQARSGKVRTAQEILDLMTSRSMLQFSSDRRSLSLSVLTHEFGHVWGLCDQYEGAANCDSKNSTSHLVLDSVMGGESSRQTVYLTDDDIQGIRALNAREGFSHNWPQSPSSAQNPVPLTISEVEHFEINNVTRDSKNLVITYSVFTNVPAKIRISLMPQQGGREIPLTGLLESGDVPFKQGWSRLSVALTDQDKTKYKVKAVLQKAKDSTTLKSLQSADFL